MFPFGIWAPIVLPMVLGGHHRKIIPYDLNGPFKQLIMSLFRLAWSSKIRLPLLITVAFLALDVNLQVEINVFWAPPADRDGGEDNEDRERPRRRHNGIHHAEGIRRGVIFPAVAPLAQFEDFEDDDDNDSDDSDSSTFSLPSDIEVPSTTIGRYIFPQIGTVPFTLNGTSHEEQQSHPHENRNGADPTEQAQEDQLVGRRVD